MRLASFKTELLNTKFKNTNSLIDKKKKIISRKYVGLYGIHSVSASNPNQTIKVFANDVKSIPHKIIKKIIGMGGKFRVIFMESQVKNPQDYHMEEIFESKNIK